jgi:DNA-binding transcriptional LysR family regulator
MDRLQAMNTFVRVAEAGSFSAVARELATTQSAVSKQVAALESHLGARLLARTTRSLSLTDEGERYFESARRLVAEVAEAEAGVARGRTQLSGWLRVSASVGFGQRVLMPQIRTFVAAHPAVKIDLKLSDGFVDLTEQGIDVAVRIGVLPADSGFLARRVAASERALYASREYLASRPARRREPKIPADLADHACIVYTELATRNAWTLTTPDGSEVTVRVSAAFQTNSSEGVRAATLAGLGITYSPHFMFDDAVARGEVVRLLPDWSAPPLPIHLLSTPERRGAAKVRAFGDHLAAAWADAGTLSVRAAHSPRPAPLAPRAQRRPQARR